MKFRLTCLALLLGLGSAASLAAPAKKPVSKRNAQAVAKVVESGEIRLAHQLDEGDAEALQALVDDFNAGSPGKKIVLTRSDFKSLDFGSADLPALMLLDEASRERFTEARARYRPVHQIMREARVSLEGGKPPGQMVPAVVDGGGKLLALPMGLSTPVMFYNKDAFARAGLNADQAPSHWFALQETLGTLRDAGFACPYTSARPAQIHIDNLSAWHNEPVVARDKRGDSLAINGLVQVKHLAMMSTWYKSRYLHIFGRGDEALSHFASGECQVLTAPSSAYPALARAAKFRLGVAPLPYHDDVRGAPQNTLADGSTLWVSAGQSAADYKSIAKFIGYVLEPATQGRWITSTGFLPLNRTGFITLSMNEVRSMTEAARIAFDQLTRKPVSASSTAARYSALSTVRDVMDSELEELWADRKPAKLVLDTAVARSRGGCSASPSC